MSCNVQSSACRVPSCPPPPSASAGCRPLPTLLSHTSLSCLLALTWLGHPVSRAAWAPCCSDHSVTSVISKGNGWEAKIARECVPLLRLMQAGPTCHTLQCLTSSPPPQLLGHLGASHLECPCAYVLTRHAPPSPSSPPGKLGWGHTAQHLPTLSLSSVLLQDLSAQILRLSALCTACLPVRRGLLAAMSLSQTTDGSAHLGGLPATVREDRSSAKPSGTFHGGG